MPRITGSQQVKVRLGKLSGPEMVKAAGSGLYAAGDIIATEAAHSITQGAVGGAKHVASLPGEPPNADTGFLDRSIEIRLVAPLRVEVSANASYAAALEFGTSKMAARPYMAPAVARKKDEALALVRSAVASIVARVR